VLRVIGVSDIHCSYQYSSRLVYEIVRHRADLVLIAGDIECEDPLEKIVGAGVRVYAVTGNMDDTYIYRVMRDYGVAIDGSIVEYMGYWIAGIGGLGFHTNYEKVVGGLGRIGGEKLIILSHYPPKGFNDKTYAGVHAGLDQLRDLLERYRPALFLHGHIHEARGVSRYNGSLIVNPGPLMHGYYSVIEFTDEGVKAFLHRL